MLKKVIDFVLNYGLIITLTVLVAFGLWYNLK